MPKKLPKSKCTDVARICFRCNGFGYIDTYETLSTENALNIINGNPMKKRNHHRAECTACGGTGERKVS